MKSGRETLSSIDAAIAQVHRQESDLDRAIQSALAEAERLAAERGKALRALARVKLDEIASGRLISGLDAAERRAADLMHGRKDRLARLSAQRDEALGRLDAAEHEQGRAAAAVETALRDVEALRSQIEARLADEEHARAARARLAEAERVATQARGKAEQNAIELAQKKKPYDDDPLFQYLWGRGFGTSAYAHRGLARFFDRMVANFIGYLDVRANYHMLGEIPQRLKDHAEAQGAMIEIYRSALSRLEREELDSAGMPALERKLAAARERLSGADAELEKQRSMLAQIDAQRDRIVEGTADPGMVEAIATMAAQDGQDDIATLRAEARRTATPEDERLVGQIEAMDRDIAAIRRQLDDLRATAATLSERRAGVEQTRERFRRSGYDHPHATFGNERVIADVLGGLLSGALKGGLLWDTLRRGYENRPPSGRPDFGGGFPFPVPGGWDGQGSGGGVSGGGWREPQSSGPWAPTEAPGNGSPSGQDDDNFTTGGRF
jgi:regulator of replication initiation timing